MRRATAAAALLAVSCGASAPGPAPAPAVELISPDGLEARLHSLRGRIIVVNFWATWCVPCVQEMPLLRRAAEVYRDRGVAFLGVSCDLLTGGTPDEKRAEVERFAARESLNFPNLLFTGGEDDLSRRFGHPGPLPYTVVLSRQGEARWRHAEVLRPGLLEAAIEAALSPGQG